MGQMKKHHIDHAKLMKALDAAKEEPTIERSIILAYKMGHRDARGEVSQSGSMPSEGIEEARMYLRAALAALTQPATFRADLITARKYALAGAEIINHIITHGGDQNDPHQKKEAELQKNFTLS
jgi:hypothetical protein